MDPDYKYFYATLLGLLPLCVALGLAGGLRRTATVAGIILALASPLSVLSERVYWTPTRVMGGGWGIEDVIFCFHTGAMSWLCAVWPWTHRLEIGRMNLAAARRLLAVCIAATAVLGSLLAAKVPIMFAFIVTQAVTAGVLLALHPSYWRLAVSGIVVFSAYYFFLLGMWSLLMPNFMTMWDGTQIIDAALLSVPLEEYLWVASISVGFPLTVAFTLGARVGTASSR